MNRITLMKSQKNELFQLIHESGLDPLNFKWKEEINGVMYGLISAITWMILEGLIVRIIF